jgi:asparagine synthase (glutamine-hydrolysing)
VHRFSPEQWDTAYGRFSRLLPARLYVSGFGRKAHKLANLLSAQSSAEFYRLLVSQWQDSSEILVDANEPSTAFNYVRDGQSDATFLETMARIDLVTYLPGDILTKVDRASMSVGLEARVPLLDHRIVEFALQLPMSFKIRGGVGKYILRKLLYRYVPKKLVDRPKMGFGVPIGRWLRGQLREWAQDLLDERAIRDAGYFRADMFRQLWREHLTGQADWSSRLWTVLMFQSWLNRWKIESRATSYERPAFPALATG